MLEQLSVKLPEVELGLSKKVAALTAATVAEATLLALLSNPKAMKKQDTKKFIENAWQKVAKASRDTGIEVAEMVHPLITSEANARALAPC